MPKYRENNKYLWNLPQFTAWYFVHYNRKFYEEWLRPTHQFSFLQSVCD